MSSIIKVDTIKNIASTDIIKKSGTSITVGTASDTTTVAGNAVRSNAIQAADGQNIISQVGTTITLGATGDTVEIATGATLVGGGIAWQSSIVTGATHTAAAGQGLWLDTSSNAITLTLPATPAVGDQIIFTDYARKWGTNAVTINQNSKKFQGGTTNPIYNTDGQSVDIVYSGVTQGWIPNSDDDVTNEGTVAFDIKYLVIAGGGAGGGSNSGGGGAGGLLTNFTGTPISFLQGSTYTATVGGGGAGVPTGTNGNPGISSVLSGSGITTITAIAGGYGAQGNFVGGDGGSGGGGGYNNKAGGSGTVDQGNDGGTGHPSGPAYSGGGGGGKGVAGADGTANAAGNGGNGEANSIRGSAITYAGGGGGATDPGSTQGTGGSGGGGTGVVYGGGSGNNGTANLGAGGGARGGAAGGNSGAGGSGVVILRLATADYSGTTSGSPTVDQSTVSGQTILIFNGDGSYTA